MSTGIITEARFNKKVTKKYYLEPDDFHFEYKESMKNGKPTDKLLKMFELIARKYITVYGSANKDDIDACINYAAFEAYRKWDKYDSDRSPNIFSFFTMMIKNDMALHYNYLHKGKKVNISIDAIFNNTPK